MNCKYNNSLYCANPPEPICDKIIITPEMILNEQIREHLYEEDFQNEEFIDLEELRIVELIKNEGRCETP